jgi:hypothetical protein
MKKLLLLVSTLALVSCRNKNTAVYPVSAGARHSEVAKPSEKPDGTKIVRPFERMAEKLTHIEPVTNLKDSLHLAGLLQSLEEAPQVFTVPPTGTTTVTGKSGTIITITPNDLMAINGSAINGPVRVALKELSDSRSLLKNNAQTMSGNNY